MAPLNTSVTNKNFAGHKEVARRWLSSADFVKKELDGVGMYFGNTPLGKDWAESVARAKHRIIARQIREAKTPLELTNIMYMHNKMLHTAAEFHTNGKLDWKKVTLAMPEYAQHGKTLERWISRAYMSPYTALGKKRLQREFAGMQRNLTSR